MPDRWGVDSSYTDASGNEQHVPPETVERLRGIIGEPQSTAPPLVLREGESLALGPGEMVLEDGTAMEVGEQPLTGLPLGYHRFSDAAGTERRVIVSPPRCYLPPQWRGWGWATQLYASRSERSWGMGDLGDLSHLSRWSKQQGA
ncbi:MAG: 4-alpha-glucanotransferase, partial [Acidimicrobiia bacterium]|nr:4-alpha-glucanotransferase [Acidimicrobiia bacterium]